MLHLVDSMRVGLNCLCTNQVSTCGFAHPPVCLFNMDLWRYDHYYYELLQIDMPGHMDALILGDAAAHSSLAPIPTAYHKDNVFASCRCAQISKLFQWQWNFFVYWDRTLSRFLLSILVLIVTPGNGGILRAT